MIRQYELVERVRAYDPQVDEDLLNRAYVFAMKAHGSQVRASGDPYFSHPLEVAGILTEMRMDAATIATALLHDTVEDTDATYEQLAELFGKEVAEMVEGVTKLIQLEDQSRELKQAENFRKLVLALSKDIRVLLVKLADRVHNMRTLHYCKPEKRGRIASETMEIYAPLAERIGISRMKEELEELSFRELHPDAHDAIVERLEMLRDSDDNVVERIVNTLREKLEADGLQAEVQGREKAPYSIWRKMRQKHVGFEQLSDIMAFRVIVNNITECYQALGIIHSKFQMTPDRFKDYISTPKANGYQSLHTTVLGPEGKRIEVQIRTREMHEVAVLGVAAHWAYKQGAQKQAPDAKHWRWLRELVEIVETAEMPEEFIEHAKLELFAEEVFCFTPTGDVINLPQGATVVDFAYAIHSDVGDHCVGGRVNGRMVPLSTELSNGDQVAISTSKNQTPSPAWERFVKTGKARARIRKFRREKEREQWASLGKAMLQKMFRQEGYEFTEKAVANVLRKLKQTDVDDVYAAIGSGVTPAKDVFNTIFPGHRSAQQQAQQTGKVPFDPRQLEKEGEIALITETKTQVKPKKGRKNKRYAKKRQPIPLKGMIPGMAVHFARCCHPLPGDRIVGIISTGRGITVHVTDCETLAAFEDAPERWLDVSWDMEEAEIQPEARTGRLTMVVTNEAGTLASISNVIAKNNANISNLKIVDRKTDFWTLLLDIEVSDTKQLSDIIAALRATPAINSVERAQGR